MSIFLLPKGLCNEINSLMQNFWWGNQESGSRIHWMKWSKMGMAKDRGGMGFRDLVNFNLALLATQCWRLLKSPDSLTAKIIKAKYYPNSSILEANLGSEPSFAWRSIHSARSLLEKGLIWRIGNGQSVKIWGDRWIPIPSTYKIQSPPRDLNQMSKVCDLIDKENEEWNQQLLARNFTKEEMTAINTIPISLLSQPDVQVWRGTTSGVFSVKSAYHLANEIGNLNTLEASTQRDNSVMWKTMWKLRLPNAAKNFFWRACHNLLPTKDNLLRRKVVKEPLCPICEREPETVVHALWSCPTVSDVWGSSHRLFQKYEKDGMDFMNIVENIFDKGGTETLTIFVNLARQIWTRRNKWIHEGSFASPNDILKRSDAFIADYAKAQERNSPLEPDNLVDRGKSLDCTE
jgi:hypothetical protein